MDVNELKKLILRGEDSFHQFKEVDLIHAGKQPRLKSGAFS